MNQVNTKKQSRINPIRVRRLMGLMLGLNIVYSVCAQVQTKEKSMNVLLLLVDDLRWNSLYCMGTDYLRTPHIDSLANDGVVFSNAYVTTAVSMVSRASILTGQYMYRHQIRSFGKAISQDAYAFTYPAQLRKAGYWVGHVGKYGVGRIRPSDYDYSSIYEGIHWYPIDSNVRIERFKNGYTRINGDSIHVTERNVQDALFFLANAPKNRPFCLSVGFYATHAEDNHPEQYRFQPKSANLYKDIEIPVPVSANDSCLRKLPAFLQSSQNEGRIRWKWRFDTPGKYQEMMKGYFRLLTEVDEGIGRIIGWLKKEGLYENTLIVFMGDNGYFHSEHQLADKWYPYEESVRIPLIIHDPRMKMKDKNRMDKSIALNIDIAPTILSAAGIEPPDIMQGHDLSALYLKHDKKKWRTEFYYEHPTISNKNRIPSSEALITLTEKYIYWPEFGVEEYYRLDEDPYEMNNLINDLRLSNKIEKIKLRFKEYKSWLNK